MSREIVLSLWLFLPILSWVVVYVGRRLFVFELIVSFLPLLVIFTILYVLIISAVYINVINFSLPLLMILFNLLIIFVVSVSYIRFYDLSIDPVKESYLRILSININPKNQRITEVNNQLAQSNFDLVSFLEFKTVTYEGLKSTLIKLYPYTNYDPKTNKYATIFSKYPLNDIDEEMGFTSYEIQVKEKRYNIFSVHATAPTTPNLFKNRNKILSYLRSKLDAQNPQNVIVMGDFNTTPWSIYYSDLIRGLSLTNLTKAKIVFTWRAFELPFVPLHVDHIFIGRSVTVKDFKTIKILGSDHLGLSVSLK